MGDFASVGVLHLIGGAVLCSRLGVDVGWVAWGRAPAARARGERAESRRVGCGLRAELGEVEIGAGLVTHGHGLAELALGPEAVEDDGVDDDAERLYDDFNDAADKGPVLDIVSFWLRGELVECLPEGGT